MSGIVEIFRRESSVVEVRAPATNVEILARGAQGIPGSSSYTHNQPTAASVWTVSHNLSRYPSLTVVDTFENVMHANVNYVSNMIATITHAAPLAGKVYCN